MENLRSFTQRSQAAKLIIAMLAALHILYSCETMDLASDDIDHTTVVMHFSPYHIESFTRNAGEYRLIEGNIYEVYTFPHEEEGTLKMTISALNEAEDVIGEAVFEGVPVKVNHITTYTGSFFSAGSAFSVTIGASAAWAGMSDHRF